MAASHAVGKILINPTNDEYLKKKNRFTSLVFFLALSHINTLPPHMQPPIFILHRRHLYTLFLPSILPHTQQILTNHPPLCSNNDVFRHITYVQRLWRRNCYHKYQPLNPVWFGFGRNLRVSSTSNPVVSVVESRHGVVYVRCLRSGFARRREGREPII
jgi:hypothetical protein